MQFDEKKSKKQTFASLAQYFDLPISQAAQLLGISETYLKRQCRVYNINRWPYRRIASLKARMQLLQDREERKPKEEQEMEDILSEIEHVMKYGLDNGEVERKISKKSKMAPTLHPTFTSSELDRCRALIEQQCKVAPKECNMSPQRNPTLTVYYVPYASTPSPTNIEPTQDTRNFDDYLASSMSALPDNLGEFNRGSVSDFPVVQINWAALL
jgi:AraC-like DNA-binding protein